MNSRTFVRCLSTLLLFLGLSFSARAEGRLALVIGVGQYDGKFGLSALPGIAHDVSKMKASLEAVGFTVTALENPSLTEAEEAIDNFGNALKANKGVGLFYFSGHGGEFEGKNYLIPKGARLTNARDIKEQGVAAQRILNRMEDAGNGTNILFLDCCRNNMTKATTDSGMAAMNAKGTFIGFATASEKTAAASTDGSPYTGSLSQFMLKPGVSITDMHTLVTRDVENQTRSAGVEVQTPFQYSGLNDVFYFVPSGSAVPAAPNTPAPAAP
ncbi:MAG TPA: caspase family protein, partial [Verrucomicrobiales bacterium]|nr:caspase family protein [Verrucomicrobiales bacterium]